MKAITLAAVLNVVSILVVTGCAQLPAEQLEAAAKAVEAAKTAGAEDYAKEDYIKLEQQFSLAKDALAKQENVYSVFRSYTEADDLLKQVVLSGQQVAVVAVQKKEAAKLAAMSTEKEALQMMASVKKLMSTAPNGKERAAVATIKEDVAGLETSLNAVHQLIDKGDYLAADTQSKAIKAKGAAISEELLDAIAKTKARKNKTHA